MTAEGERVKFEADILAVLQQHGLIRHADHFLTLMKAASERDRMKRALEVAESALAAVPINATKDGIWIHARPEVSKGIGSAMLKVDEGNNSDWDKAFRHKAKQIGDALEIIRNAKNGKFSHEKITEEKLRIAEEALHIIANNDKRRWPVEETKRRLLTEPIDGYAVVHGDFGEVADKALAEISKIMGEK